MKKCVLLYLSKMPINGDFSRLRFMRFFSFHSYSLFLFIFFILFLFGVCGAQEGIKISEILFDPPQGGSDYLELFNDSDSPASLKHVRLAQWKADAISKLYTIDTSYTIAPNDYCVVTTDAQYVKDSFVVRHPEKIIQVKSMPSYNNASGTVIVCLDDTTLLDRFDYTASMHSRLLKDVEGVSLERRSFLSPTQDDANWFSAASTAGYGTPTYANSQSREFLFVDDDFVVEPDLFSPDNDGYDDLLNISYNLSTEDLSANIYVTDKNGRIVRYLLRGGTLGTHGVIVWDGLDESAQRCRQGRYVLVIEAYNTDGKKQTTRKVVTLVAN